MSQRREPEEQPDDSDDRAVLPVILVVDDERAIRESLTQALEETGHRVLQATNGHHALNVISSAAPYWPDLIIADVMMPLVGGVELCRTLKNNSDTAEIPVILMSAAGQRASAGAQPDAFIAKPFDLDAVDMLIDSLTGAARDLRPRTALDTGGPMNRPERLEPPPVDAAPSMVTLQFRHDQKNSGVSRHGQLRPNGPLRIEYDHARVVPEGVTGTTVTDVICHVRFQPSGEQRSGRSVQHVHHPARAPRPLVFEERIPTGTTQVEVWFEARAPTGTVGWDSRYGQNYTFAIADEGLPIPERSVALRSDARVDASRIGVVDDAASKEPVTTGASGTRLRTGLVVRARVGKPSASAVLWADVHVFDATGDVIHAGSIALEPGEPSMADAVRLWDAEVYAGSGGASGAGVWSRPDAHTVQYRLYCQENTQVFTDGVLHQFEVPADTDVRPIPGGW